MNSVELVGLSFEVYAILFCAQSSIKIVCNFDLLCFIRGNLLLQWAGSLKLGFNSLGDFSTNVKVKFNSYKTIPHYCNNKFALHMHTFSIYALILNTLNITIH